MNNIFIIIFLTLLGSPLFGVTPLEKSFLDPPDTAKPWVFWFWINGNISNEGITKDLEAMKGAGINGLIWMEVSGPWWAPQGKIEAGTPEWDDAMQWGTDKVVAFPSLMSWSEHSDSLIRYFSGMCAYKTEFEFKQEDLLDKKKVFLNLGSVEVMATVRLNGKDLDTVWKPPYRVELTQAIQQGNNELEIQVANTWVNRLIGDEQEPLDAEWKNWTILLEWPEWFVNGKNRPSGRYTFTSARHYTKDNALKQAGLLGPVTLEVSE